MGAEKKYKNELLTKSTTILHKYKTKVECIKRLAQNNWMFSGFYKFRRRNVARVPNLVRINLGVIYSNLYRNDLVKARI
eukprot:maker-scaffold_16-snap-gene-2.55-mRNA-1 protein AED:0.45 eAED:1.00 QI:0/0/0/1/0/0/2/0/78